MHEHRNCGFRPLGSGFRTFCGFRGFRFLGRPPFYLTLTDFTVACITFSTCTSIIRSAILLVIESTASLEEVRYIYARVVAQICNNYMIRRVSLHKTKTNTLLLTKLLHTPQKALN